MRDYPCWVRDWHHRPALRTEDVLIARLPGALGRSLGVLVATCPLLLLQEACPDHPPS